MSRPSPAILPLAHGRFVAGHQGLVLVALVRRRRRRHPALEAANPRDSRPRSGSAKPFQSGPQVPVNQTFEVPFNQQLPIDTVVQIQRELPVIGLINFDLRSRQRSRSICASRSRSANPCPSTPARAGPVLPDVPVTASPKSPSRAQLNAIARSPCSAASPGKIRFLPELISRSDATGDQLRRFAQIWR